MSDSPAADSGSTIKYRDGRVEDAPGLAQLMYTQISWGRLRDFGVGFLTLLNRAFCTSPHAVCVVAEENGRVVGYVAGVVHLGRFYREFALRRGIPAAIAIIPKLFQRQMLQTLWKGLTYRKDPGTNGPQSEVLVLAVASGFSGRGIGNRLFTACMTRLRERGVDAVRLGTVAETNQVALAMYIRYGFKIVETKRFYDDSKVHVMEYRFDSTPQ